MIWYSVFVRSFADGNGDGIGDLKGLCQHLEYFKGLGVEGLWLLPIHPSPSYHKYDVIDYYHIDPDYGTMKDFHQLLHEAHRRGLKIMLDLVLNHCSEKHLWFRQAIKSKRSPFRDWFVWKDAAFVREEEKNVWHQPEEGPSDQAYYGFFWKGMPDLNYDHVPVRRKAIEIANFWLGHGVDGLRLDAAMHIFPAGRENDNVKWWQEFRAGLQNDTAFTVGEITESCGYIAPYLRKGLHSAFNFELAEHIIQAITYGRHDCLADWLKGVQTWYLENDAEAKDAIFLSNHDQTRIASRLGNAPEKIKLAASILMSLPGEIFLYYGEELGMTGEKPDEYLREPFLWNNSADPPGCTWEVPRYSYPLTVRPYLQQQADPDSIYHHYRALIAARKMYPALSEGDMHAADCSDSSVILFTRHYQGSSVLVMHNLSNEGVRLYHEDENHTAFKVLFASEGCRLSESGHGIFELSASGSLMAEVS